MNRWADAALVAGAVSISALNSGFGKPIWMDEYLHFAMGSLTFQEALDVVLKSTGDGVNWGQTGSYLLLDYGLLSVFGANLWALRAPSLAAGIVLGLGAVWFLRCKGLPRIWQFLVLMALGGQETLMYYTGEARPYLPMAASVVSVLAFYSASSRRRRSPVGRAFGSVGLLVGAAFHPYWLAYTTGILVYTFWVARRSGQPLTWRQVVQHTSWRFLVAGIGIYTAVGLLTWAKGQTSFRTDPWAFIHGPVNWLRAVGSTHLDFMSPQSGASYELWNSLFFSISPSRVASLLAIAFLTINAMLNSRVRPLVLPPMVLLWLALVSTTTFSALSYVRSYWVIERQWLGGIALVPIAMVWAIGLLWNYQPKFWRYWPRVFAACFTVVVVAQFASAMAQTAHRPFRHSESLAVYELPGTPDDIVNEAFDVGDPAFAANINVARGDRVWRVHSRYYGIDP